MSYGTKHPYGEYVTEETVNNVTYGDVKSFYDQRFNPNKAYLVIVGDVKYSAVKKEVEKNFSDWKKSVDVKITVPDAQPNVQFTQINFVDMPNAVQSNISLTTQCGSQDE